MFQSRDACIEKRLEPGEVAGSERPGGGQGRGGQGWSPAPTPEARGGAQVGPRRSRRRVPARPSALRGILYNSPSRSKRKRGARCRGRRAEVLKPRVRGAPHAAPMRGVGEGPSAGPTRPLAKALGRSRSPSGSCERHQLRQLLQTPCPVSLQPGSRRRGARAAGRAGRRDSGEDKVPGDPPVARSAQPRCQHPYSGVGNLGPSTTRGPCNPLISQGSRGESSPGPSGRTAALESSKRREATTGVPEHRSYLALGRPRSGRAARGAWCTSARAWGGR